MDNIKKLYDKILYIRCELLLETDPVQAELYEDQLDELQLEFNNLLDKLREEENETKEE